MFGKYFTELTDAEALPVGCVAGGVITTALTKSILMAVDGQPVELSLDYSWEIIRPALYTLLVGLALTAPLWIGHVVNGVRNVYLWISGSLIAQTELYTRLNNLVSKGVTITTDRLNYIINRHGFNSAFLDKSRFLQNSNVDELIKEGIYKANSNVYKVEIVPQGSWTQLTITFDRIVGTDSGGKITTNILRVVLDEFGKVYNSYPIIK